jgi:uncharacterized zinc-type alcohol dehydrogenase-like protein
MATGTPTRAYLATAADSGLSLGEIQRRQPRDIDVTIKIHYCGVCHSDLHTIHNEWHNAVYPICAGHEITGIVEAVGSKVTKFKVGDRVGVGCIVGSCLECNHCKNHDENHCEKGFIQTYNYDDPVTPGWRTHGGYSDRIVIEEHFVLSIPDGLDLALAAPILCAGITTYTPLVEANIKSGSSVGIVGIGGLGHMALKLARALDAHVIAFTSKASKKDELIAMGAHEVVVTSDAEAVKKIQNTLDLIVDTVSADHDVGALFGALKSGGTYHILGAPSKPFQVPGFPLIFRRLNFKGTLIGGLKRTQEVLDLCAAKGVTPICEMAELKDINHVMERLEKGDVRYRFVLDVKNGFSN